MLNTASDSISIFTASVFRTNSIFPSLESEQKDAQGRYCMGIFLSLNRVSADGKFITQVLCNLSTIQGSVFFNTSSLGFTFGCRRNQMILKQTNKQESISSHIQFCTLKPACSSGQDISGTYTRGNGNQGVCKTHVRKGSWGQWKHSVLCMERTCSAIRNGCTLLTLYSGHSRRCRGAQRCCPAGQRAPARWALLPGSFSGGADQSYISLRHACWLGGTGVCWLWRKNKEKADKSNGHLTQSVRLMGIKASYWTEHFKTRSSAFYLDLLEALSRSPSGSRLSHISYWAGKTKTTL